MRNLILSLAIALSCGGAAAQNAGGTKPVSSAPDTIMPASKMYIDLSTIPPARAGYNTPRARIVCTGVYDSGTPACTDHNASANFVPNRYDHTPSNFDDQNGGSFRTICSFSHASFDDPIVWPGQSGRTHLHVFFGNTNTRSSSDLANMASAGNSTCNGGTLNRTGYWTPTFVYSRPGNGRDGEVLQPSSLDAYYKMAKSFDSNCASYGCAPQQWPPAGFRMISGNPANTSAAGLPGNKRFYDCYFNGATQVAYPGYRFNHIPTDAQAKAAGNTNGCNKLRVSIVFNDCWDGVNLDVPTHGVDETPGVTHIIEADFNTGCTTTPAYPINFPEISFNIDFDFTAADIDYYRLSSDYTATQAAIVDPTNCNAASNYCAGRSLHGDWVGGWSTTANGGVGYGWGGLGLTAVIRQECHRVGWVGPPTPQASDCHADLLGSPALDDNWWALY